MIYSLERVYIYTRAKKFVITDLNKLFQENKKQYLYGFTVNKLLKQ